MRFGATEHGFFSDLKGFGIIHRLLQQPDPPKPISAVDLMGGDSSRGDETYTEQLQLDNNAIEDYRKQLQELTDEIEEANKHENIARVEKLETERDDITKVLANALNIKGQSRPLGPASPEKKARKALQEDLKRAYRKMETSDSPLANCAKHFRSSIRAEGTAYAYRPTKSLDWEL